MTQQLKFCSRATSVALAVVVLGGCSLFRKNNVKEEQNQSAVVIEQGQGQTQSPSTDPNLESNPAPTEASLTTVVESVPESEHTLVWGYTGEVGPKHWAALDPSFHLCGSGKKQSPIDLRWKKPKLGLTVKLNFSPTLISLTDNGHTLMVKPLEAQSSLIHGKRYELDSIHFHSSSEHTIAGNSLPMEAHFVHKDSNGNLAVIGVILIEGAGNQAVDKMFANWPAKKHQEVQLPENIDWPALLPSTLTHYAYEGSLTTPPCTEGVKWFVLNTPVEISREQLLMFRTHYTNNSRPVQPANNRTVVNH